MFLLRDLAYRCPAIRTQSTPVPNRARPCQTLDSEASDGVELVCGFFHFQSGLSSLIVEEGLADLDPAAPKTPLAVRRGRCSTDSGRMPAHRWASQTLLERLTHLLFLYVLRQQVMPGSHWAG